MKKEFLTMSRSSAAIALAISDTFYLILSFLNVAFNYLYIKRLFHLSAITCYLSAFTFAYVLSMESFMVLILTIERAVSVIRPFWIKPYFTRKMMTTAVITISLLLLTFDFYHGFFNAYYDIDPIGQLGCMYPANFTTTLQELLRGAIPLSILLPSNILIIVKLFQQRKKWRNDQTSESAKKSFNITLMIVSVTASFTFLALPSSIHVICCRFFPTFYEILDYVNILSVLNASLNFYLYTASSKAFRMATKQHFASIGNKVTQFFSRNTIITPVEN